MGNNPRRLERWWTRRRFLVAGGTAGIAGFAALGRWSPPLAAREATPGVEAGAVELPGYPPIAAHPSMLEVLEERGERVLVGDAFGEVEIPREPQRVVAIDEFTLEILLALEITPVAAGHLGTSFPAAVGGMVDGVASLPNRDLGVNLEAVAAAQPDLIIGGNRNLEPGVFELLRQIAPTVVVREFAASYWERGLFDLGRVLGRAAEASTRLAEFEAELAPARETVRTIAGPDATFDVILFFPDAVWLYGPVYEFEGAGYPVIATKFLYLDLRLRPSPSTRELVPLADGFVQLSIEVLPQLKGDYLVVFPTGYEDVVAPGYEEVVESRFWQEIPAVANGKAVTLDVERANGYFSTLAAVDRFVAELRSLPATSTPFP